MLSGIRLYVYSVSDVMMLGYQGVRCKGCQMSGCQVSGVRLSDVRVSGCTMSGCQGVRC